MANGNGWADAQRTLGVILAAIALLGIIAGSVYAWADVRYNVGDACRRVEVLERRQDQARDDALRMERKIDRLLIEQGLDPDSIGRQ
jgi:hypothetical protein